MNFDCLSAEEIRTRYRRADNKSEIIQVLADLTCSSKLEMCRFLGVEPPKRKPKNALDEKMALVYYKAGMTDQEIAERLDVSETAVCVWRKSAGLPFKNQKGEEYADSEKVRMRLWSQGLNDAEIGDVLGITCKAVFNWRQRRGLSANARQGRYDRSKMKGAHYGKNRR